MKYEIYELYPSARHAYIAIGLAVKTSRPRIVKERYSQKRIAKLAKSLRTVANPLILGQILYQSHLMHFGLVKERKTPPDRRVVLSPEACQYVLETFPDAKISVESSDIRIFRDNEYREAGIPVTDTVAHCDVLLGVKEVPIDALIPNKKYFFFSHTIKKQPYNRDLLRAILDKKIELYDHEVITNPNGIRLVAFGRYAGIVGAYNGIRAYGLKNHLFTLPQASDLKDREALITQLKEVQLPPIKILVTGKGRVGNGVREILTAMHLTEVGVQEFLNGAFDYPVFCQIDVLDYNRRKDGKKLSESDFFQNPEDYESNFLRFTKVTDLYMAAHFYGTGAPEFFSREDARSPDFKINTIADISCDIGLPIPSTIRASTIAEPIYGINPETWEETDYTKQEAIAVMAVDNLPAELPRDASEGFGNAFINEVIPAFFNGDANGILERAQMTTSEGTLTKRFAHLGSYVEGED